MLRGAQECSNMTPSTTIALHHCYSHATFHARARVRATPRFMVMPIVWVQETRKPCDPLTAAKKKNTNMSTGIPHYVSLHNILVGTTATHTWLSHLCLG